MLAQYDFLKNLLIRLLILTSTESMVKGIKALKKKKKTTDINVNLCKHGIRWFIHVQSINTTVMC